MGRSRAKPVRKRRFSGQPALSATLPLGRLRPIVRQGNFDVGLHRLVPTCAGCILRKRDLDEAAVAAEAGRARLLTPRYA
jgi:hypothetical protein